MQHPVHTTIFSLILTTALSINLQAQALRTVAGPVSEGVSDSRSVNFLDVNNDGWEDLYISNGPQGGQKDLMYVNDGTGQFTAYTGLGIVGAVSPSDGASFADVNNDGHIDGIVSSWYGAADVLYVNDGSGNLNFNATANAGLTSGSFAETAAFGDYDNDGWVDIYITNSGSDLANYLYRNLRNGSFQQITNHPLVAEAKASRAALWGDFNTDGLTDLFVANEGNTTNDMYLGTGGGGFEKVTEGNVVTEGRNSITASWGDIDNDGDYDLFVGNSNFFRPLNNQLFLNEGGRFTAVTESPIVSALGCTFGSAFGDYDNDGDLDLVIANGFCNANMENILYENQGDGTFIDASNEIENNEGVCSFGIAWGDINNDGFLDLATANCKNSATSDELPNSLWVNEGNNNAWLAVQLTGVSTNRSALGARLEARAVIDGTPTWQMREITGQTGYAGQNSLVAHFGLGDAATVDTLVIHWPAGNRQVLTDVGVNQRLAITEVINVHTETATPLPSSLSLDIFPNPVSDTAGARLRIQHVAAGTGHVFVYNTLGQVVHQEGVPLHPGSNELVLDTARFAPGVYHIVLQVESGRLGKQLVVR